MILFLLFLLIAAPAFCADAMNVTVTGQSQEKPELESLSAKPDIPSVKSLAFADDDTASAANPKINPLTLGLEKSNIPIPSLPLIPTAPYVVQPLPRDDDPQFPQLKPFGHWQKDVPPIAFWEFHVVDELNHAIFTSSGIGKPASNPNWDGTINDTLVVDPNRTYSSFLIYKSTINTTATFLGEAERFMAFSNQTTSGEEVTFGERVYKSDSALFSPEGEFYLNDLKSRLLSCKRTNILESTRTVRAPWLEITIFETPEHIDSALANRRKSTWISFLSTLLQNDHENVSVTIRKSSSQDCSVLILMRNFNDEQRPVMTGIARDPRPLFENQSDWIIEKELRGNLTIELRHDRLFRIGSATLRDQAVPLLLESLKHVQAERERSQKRLIILRSLIEKPLEGKKSKTLEEDPKLDALRSKVLFMLYAKTRYLN